MTMLDKTISKLNIYVVSLSLRPTQAPAFQAITMTALNGNSAVFT